VTESWAFTGTPPVTEGQPTLTTLVEGATFCISTASGNIIPGAPMGLFVHDARVLSLWEVLVDGGPLEPLAVDAPTPLEATYVTRTRPGGRKAPSSSPEAGRSAMA
jgi:N-terminal domain of (some) glycogen debranching enzymes